MAVYLSASSINDFIKCSQKVLYRIKKTVPEVPSKEMVTGKIVHSALEKGWMDREIAYQIIDTEAKAKDVKKADITNMKFGIDMYFLNFKHLVGEGDHIEYYFKIPLYDDVFIVGKMDRIHNGNIIDWKSGRTPKSLSNDIQCIIYDFSYYKLFGKKAASVNIAALATGKLIPYMADDVYKSEVFNHIIPRMIKTIKSESYERLGMFTHGCFRCPYKQGCLGDRDVVDNSESSQE